MSSRSAPTGSGSPLGYRRSSFASRTEKAERKPSSQPGCTPYREPPRQVLLDPQIVPEHRPHLKLQRVVPLLTTAGLRCERIERATFVEVDERQRAVLPVAESDQRAQQLGAEPRLFQRRIDR